MSWVAASRLQEQDGAAISTGNDVRATVRARAARGRATARQLEAAGSTTCVARRARPTRRSTQRCPQELQRPGHRRAATSGRSAPSEKPCLRSSTGSACVKKPKGRPCEKYSAAEQPQLGRRRQRADVRRRLHDRRLPPREGHGKAAASPSAMRFAETARRSRAGWSCGRSPRGRSTPGSTRRARWRLRRRRSHANTRWRDAAADHVGETSPSATCSASSNGTRTAGLAQRFAARAGPSTRALPDRRPRPARGGSR